MRRILLVMARALPTVVAVRGERPRHVRSRMVGVALAGTLSLGGVVGSLQAVSAQPVSAADATGFVAAERAAWTMVSQRHVGTSYWNSAGVARVGLRAFKNDTWRSLFRMDLSAAAGTRVVRATFRASQTAAAACSGPPMELWVTQRISRATTWKDQPTWLRKLDDGHGSFCPVGGVEFEATSAVAEAVAQQRQFLTLGLRSADEADPRGYRELGNDPVLVIEFTTTPDVPTGLQIDPGLPCATGDGRPFVGTTTPVFRATVTTPAAANVAAHFEWGVLGGDLLGEVITTAVSSGAQHQARVPEGQLADGGTYAWRVRAEQGLEVSDWSSWCEFSVDVTAPDQPPGVSSPEYPETLAGQEPVFGGGVGIPGSFTFTAGGVPDVAGYLYGLNTSPSTMVATPVPGGSVTVTITPTTDFLNRLRVQSVDRTGRRGPIRDYEFYVLPG